MESQIVPNTSQVSISSIPKRFWAWVLDIIILQIPWFFLQPLNSPLIESMPYLFTLLYFVILESKIGTGQTIGKRLLGLRVVSNSGEMLDLRHSFLRYFFAYLLPSGIALMGGAVPSSLPPNISATFITALTISFCYTLWDTSLIFFDSCRRTLHDQFSKSLVLNHKGYFDQTAVKYFISNNVSSFKLSRGLPALGIIVLCVIGIGIISRPALHEFMQSQAQLQSMKAANGLLFWHIDHTSKTPTVYFYETRDQAEEERQSNILKTLSEMSQAGKIDHTITQYRVDLVPRIRLFNPFKVKQAIRQLIDNVRVYLVDTGNRTVTYRPDLGPIKFTLSIPKMESPWVESVSVQESDFAIKTFISRGSMDHPNNNANLYLAVVRNNKETKFSELFSQIGHKWEKLKITPVTKEGIFLDDQTVIPVTKVKSDWQGNLQTNEGYEGYLNLKQQRLYFLYLPSYLDHKPLAKILKQIKDTNQ